MCGNETFVDDVVFRLTFNTRESMNSGVNDIINTIINTGKCGISYNSSISTKYIQITDIMSTGFKVGSILRGIYTRKGGATYYINITFYGMRQYEVKKYNITLTVLTSLINFINEKDISYEIVELGIVTDFRDAFDKFLVVAVRKAPNCKYNSLKKIERDKQFKGSFYVEAFNPKQRKYALKYGVLFDKQLRDYSVKNIDKVSSLTRFKLKIQPRWFITKTLSKKAIEKLLNSYKIIKFTTLKHKEVFAKSEIINVDKVNGGTCCVIDMSNVEKFIKDVCKIEI